MSRAVLRDRFGIYLHVPFCSKKCDYCSFATWTDRDHLVEDYLQACKAQAREAASSISSISSVFIGGGTPNLVPAQLLMDIFDGLPLHPDAEFTVECNPDHVTPDDLEIYVDHGVNRISLGVQSMVPHVLRSLGREHNPDNVYNSVEIIRNAGIKNLNLDLIYGAQGETLKDWDRSLSEVLALQPDHISAYALTVEAGTPLAKAPERHPDDDDQAEKYLLADDRITFGGYSNYEISNWARKSKECRHNLLYWSQGEYLGLGVAAHSHIDLRRFWSVRIPERFIAAIANGESVEAGSERLEAENRELEARQLALRLREGVPEIYVPDEVQHLMEASQVEGNLRLNLQGRLLANEVAIRLR